MADKKIEESKDILETIADGNLGIRDQLKRMVEGSFENTDLDPETFMLVRIAALAAMDAAPASWLVNLKVGKEMGIPLKRATDTLIAISPIIGTARVVSASGSIIKAFKMAELIKEKSSVQQAL